MERERLKRNKKKKLKPISTLKKKLWKEFSIFIRQTDMNGHGLTACVTCGVVGHWTSFHSGHFIHGHSKQTFLDDRNVHVQCVKCNHYLSGNLIEYSEFMRKKYGPDIIEVLQEKSHMIWKPSRQELNELILHYKEINESKA